MVEPALEITFLGHIPSKKNSGRTIRRGGHTYHVPSAAHERWRTSELLSIVAGLPGCLAIAQQCCNKAKLTLSPDDWSAGEVNRLAKAMRSHPAIYPAPYALEYAFTPGTLAGWDLSNAEESINDLLVDARIIQDDSWHYLRRRTGWVAGYEQGNEQCVVRLHCLPRNDADDALDVLQRKDGIKRLAQTQGMTQRKVKNDLLKQLALIKR